MTIYAIEKIYDGEYGPEETEELDICFQKKEDAISFIKKQIIELINQNFDAEANALTDEPWSCISPYRMISDANGYTIEYRLKEKELA